MPRKPCLQRCLLGRTEQDRRCVFKERLLTNFIATLRLWMGLRRSGDSMFAAMFKIGSAWFWTLLEQAATSTLPQCKKERLSIASRVAHTPNQIAAEHHYSARHSARLAAPPAVTAAESVQGSLRLFVRLIECGVSFRPVSKPELSLSEPTVRTDTPRKPR